MIRIIHTLLAAIFFASCFGGGQEGPEGSANVAPAAVVRGTYTRQQNDCEDDESELTVVQDLTTLLFRGGFDYQSASPDEFDGYISDDGTIRFTLEEGATTLTCTATYLNSVLAGSCSEGGESCSFTYQKKSE